MGTIQSGVGLVSGLDTRSLIEQLMAVEARPRNVAQSMIRTLDAVKAAWQDLSGRLLALQSAAASFDDLPTFQGVTAVSADPAVITASARAGAAQGVYQLTPVRLTTNHQVIAAGWPDADVTPVGAGTIAIDLGHGHLNVATPLALLNGQAGVSRGSIRIADRSGASAAIDLTTAVSVEDVLDAINRAASISVRATVSGDRIVLTDTSGSTSQALTVSEVDRGATAAGLGILGTAAGNVLTGQDVLSVNASTSLSILNDGNGVRVRGGDDVRFTLEDGTELLVDLSGATTLGDVISRINAATGNDGKLVAAIAGDGDRLTLTDTTGGEVGPLTVAAVGGSQAALDLGLLGSDQDADHVITGKRLVAGLNSVLLRNLNGGAGVEAGSILIQDRGTGSAVVDLSAAESVQDVLDAVNAAGVSVTASLSSAGNGLVITDTSGQALRNFLVAESGGTTAADLKILHDAATTVARSGHLYHRYVSENSLLDDLGVARGRFVITDSAGSSATIDLTSTSLRSLGQVIDLINSKGIGVVASINSDGNGLLLTDTAAGGGKLTVAESGSTTAADLCIRGSDTDGDGVINGSRRITVEIGETATLKQAAAAINAASKRLSATVINDGSPGNPYRLVITSQVGGERGRLVIDAGATGLGFSTMVQPQDALLFLGAPSNPASVAVRARSNSITSVIDGVTLNLVGTSSSPVNVSVTASVDALVGQIKGFVTSFNSVVSRIDTLTAYDSKANTRGALQGDATAIRMRSSLFSMVTASVSGATGSVSRLAQIGLSVVSGKELSFDEEAFRRAFADDPSGVTSLFTLASAGIGDRIESVLTDLTDKLTGTIQRQVNSLDSRRELLTKRVAQLDALLERKRTRLSRQFLAMETVLAGLQKQSSALAGLAGALTTATSSGILG